MANVRIRGRNATGQNFEYYRPLSSFGTTTRFRMWAEQKVYGWFNAVESCQVANINVLQYQPKPGQRWSDCRVPRRTVEEGYVTPLPEQHRMLATMYAAIEWRDVTGRWIPFHDYQWLYIMPRESIEADARTHNLPLNSFPSVVAFRLWAEQEVYGQFWATRFRLMTSHSLLRFWTINGVLNNAVVLHEEPLRLERLYAILTTGIHWTNAAGLQGYFRKDADWEFMGQEADDIEIYADENTSMAMMPQGTPQTVPIFENLG